MLHFRQSVRVFHSTIFCVLFADSDNKIRMLNVKGKQQKLRMQPAPSIVGDRVRIKNAYLIEFPSDGDVRDHYQRVTRSVQASHGISESKVKMRRIIRSSLFSGVSISVTDENAVEALEMIEDAIAIYPIYTIQMPQPIKSAISSKIMNSHKNDYAMNSHNLTGVASVHQELRNYGRGVRVTGPIDE